MDCVLVYRNRKLAVDEAKAWDKPLTEGVAQAKDYAGKMAMRFAYATNVQGIYAIDMETGKERRDPAAAIPLLAATPRVRARRFPFLFPSCGPVMLLACRHAMRPDCPFPLSLHV